MNSVLSQSQIEESLVVEARHDLLGRPLKGYYPGDHYVAVVDQPLDSRQNQIDQSSEIVTKFMVRNVGLTVEDSNP
jgi:hypothetical protein